MKIFVINAGSSSVKYQLIEPETGNVLAKGLCERIGMDAGHIKHTSTGKPVYDALVDMPDHAKAISVVIGLLQDKEYGVISSLDEIDAVGHRVVHGGEEFFESVLIDDKVLASIEKCVPLAPLHNPANITGIKACMEVMGSLPQVAVFDTAFHHTMEKKAYMYAIPYEFYEKYGVRKYGFHGTSHRYVSSRMAQMLGKPIEDLKLIVCHLGNGSSLCAVDKGKSVDTSMGFTPMDGLPMGTRPGHIDAGAVLHMIINFGIKPDEVLNILNKKSGMLGVSGVSSDFRDLEKAASEGNERSALAREMFCYTVKKTIGSYMAAMGGVDAIAFAGGVGENDSGVRESILEGLEWFGIVLDKEKNNGFRSEGFICAEESKVALMVVPTNEELMIALDTKAIVEKL
ncbi:MAG: acetate kinase [Oscillospiraceae bacterium]|nr:acetate kinase [Oscillospiraceae bacterium]